MSRTRTDADIPLQSRTDVTATAAHASAARLDITVRRAPAMRATLTTGILVGALSLGLFAPSPAFADADGAGVGSAHPRVTTAPAVVPAERHRADGQGTLVIPPADRPARVRVVPTLTTIADVTPFLAPAGILALLFAAGAVIVTRVPAGVPTSALGSVGMGRGTDGGA
ncbi:hypothetical protein [Agromyces atrinae]|uniref:Uncharacterized protein n=1 Tax=Agromyces atrinae TaxID=592376 RepID=A0A4Q2MCE9_9MICO|nr:hypothetical protein [Agromyces atrinae]NYD67420.1 hypothetical protein [Agromyces atrinae]RXZ86760.1 hypothetical protein ESP50_06735 [Agromyces atrinae]